MWSYNYEYLCHSSHKYIKREYKNGHYVYTYPDDRLDKNRDYTNPKNYKVINNYKKTMNAITKQRKLAGEDPNLDRKLYGPTNIDYNTEREEILKDIAEIIVNKIRKSNNKQKALLEAAKLVPRDYNYKGTKIRLDDDERTDIFNDIYFALFEPGKDPFNSIPKKISWK